MQFPVWGRAVTHVDAWIHGHVHIAPCVFHRHKSCGDGHLVQQDVMLQIAADIRSVHTEGVVAIRPLDMMCLRQRFAQITANEVFVAQFCSEGRASCLPVEIGACTHTIHIRTVIIVFHLLCLTPISLIAVAVLVPVETGAQV